MVEKTTIQVSKALKRELDKHKMNDSDTYEGVIWDLVEDHKVLNEETIKEIEQARKEFREGKGIPFEEVKRRLAMR